ncbi:MAG: phytanoyl-CoA dioxygenase family protein [Caldilineaceae bacterium]|nr:phytanoyl-CoA dioxygenase family protein [Caldilineaceae bacterium]
MSFLEKAVTDRFEEQGYVVAEGILDPVEDIGPIVAEYEELLDSMAGQWHAEGRLSSSFSELPFGERLTQVLAEGMSVFPAFDISLPPLSADSGEETPIHLGAAVFNRLLRNPRLLDAVECFIGPEIYCNPVQHVRIKPPEHLVPEAMRHSLVASVDWHQDAGVVEADADDTDLLSAWVAITDATTENSCMVMIPGSHRADVALHCLTYDRQGFAGSAQLTIPQEYRGPKEPMPVPMRAGDVLFFHRMTMHASLPNVSNGIRWSFDLRYNPLGQHSGRPWFPGFVARSRAHPETELTDPAEWARLWQDAQAELAGGGTPAFNRWKDDDPRCA